MPSVFRRLLRRHLLHYLGAPVRNALAPLGVRLEQIEQRLDRVQEAIGRVEARQLRASSTPGEDDETAWDQAEFRAFSQWGEDGLIQRLIHRLNLRHRTFVEFGSDNFLGESNARFLLTACGWRGLVMDGSGDNLRRLQRTSAYCNHEVRVAQTFLTAENIDQALAKNGFEGALGLLSIDVDGNDFWIWSAITVVRADVVVIEYNPRFGPEVSIVVPYDPGFVRHRAHPSGFYYGASLEALRRLGKRLGYRLVGCNRNGGNAFFAREELCASAGLSGRSTLEAYAPATFSEVSGVDPDGTLRKATPAEEAATLASLRLPLLTVETDGVPAATK